MKGILKSIGLVAVVACVVAPGAFAMVDVESGGGVSTTPSVAYSSNHPLPQAQVAIPYLSQGIGVDPAAFGGTGVVAETPSYRFITDTLGGNGGGSTPVASTPGNGFDWGDAGIGMGAAAGVFLLLAGAAALGQRRRPRPVAAS